MSGSRWVCMTTASGYSPASSSRCHRCAGDLSSHWSAGCRTAGAGGTAGASGRRAQVGLVEQPVVVGGQPVLDREDHAAEVAGGDAHALLRERAPIGWKLVKPGMSESAMARVASTSSMRGSVSYVAVSGGGSGRSTSHVSGARRPGPGPAGRRGSWCRSGAGRRSRWAGRRDRRRSPDGRAASDDAEPVGEVVHELAGRDLDAELVQPRLGRRPSTSMSSPSCHVASPKSSAPAPRGPRRRAGRDRIGRCSRHLISQPMRAWRTHDYGPPLEVLQLDAVARPSPTRAKCGCACRRCR